MERDAQQAAQAGPAEGEAPPEPEGPSAADAKMQEHQVKMQIAQQKAELDMRIKQAKFEQEQAIRDAENVMKMREIS